MKPTRLRNHTVCTYLIKQAPEKTTSSMGGLNA